MSAGLLCKPGLGAKLKVRSVTACIDATGLYAVGPMAPLPAPLALSLGNALAHPLRKVLRFN